MMLKSGHQTNGAIVVFPSPVTVQHRASIIAAAAEQRLPAMYPYRFFTVDGGLMSYGSLWATFTGVQRHTPIGF
jgi:hypothetical protein